MPNPPATIHLELHSKSKRRNSRISSPCLGILPADYQKASLRKAPRALPLVQTHCSTERVQPVRPPPHWLLISCVLWVRCRSPTYLFEDLYGLPLTVEEITSLKSLALAAVTSNATLASILRPDALLLILMLF